MANLFGTDGVRGIANTELSAILALKLGMASAHALRTKHEGARMLIGRDPRISGDVLESAMAAGICSLGVDVYLVGMIPTPAVAFLTQHTTADAGIVISASHNPMRDNGIKFFGGDGYKLPDEIEAEIEARLDECMLIPRPDGAGVGRMHRVHDMEYVYMDHVKSLLRGPLTGMKVVLDCANGAVSELAPLLFTQLGADVTTVNCEPDGLNINRNCGSLHPDTLQARVIESRADLGVAFDGDGDRAILVDEKGRTVDGDHVMAICGIHLAATGNLPDNRVVATVMSNMGLQVALKQHGISMARTKVGDRYVSDEMRKTGAALGGEKSGHIIFSSACTTGDGLVTALNVLNVMLDTGSRLSDLADQMQEYPQLLVNIPVTRKDGWAENPEIRAAIQSAENQLRDRGRLVVRPSGTERLLRVMAEGPDLSEVEQVTHSVADVIRRLLT